MHKKLYIYICTALCLCALVLSAGCARRGDDDSTSGSEILPSSSDTASQDSSAAAPPTEDLDWYYTTYVHPISLELVPSFTATEPPKADDLIFFFLTANYYGDDKLPLPDGYRSDSGALTLPATAVDDFIAKYFDLPAGYAQSSSMYNKSKKAYTLEGFGMSGSSRAVVTNAKQVGDEITLVLDGYRTEPDPQNPDKLAEQLVTTKIIYLKQTSEHYKIVATRMVYQRNLTNN